MAITPQFVIENLQKPGCPEGLSPKDVDKLFLVISPLFEKFIDKKVCFLLYNSSMKVSSSDLPYKANVCQAKEVLKKALGTYLFVSKKWKIGVPLIPYLLKAIINHFKRECWVNDGPKRNKYICPCCREFNLREPLTELSNGVLFCRSCDEFLTQDVESENKRRIVLANVFKKHSKKGVRCPRCRRFVPNSCSQDGKLICPYNGCGTDCSTADSKTHPVGLFSVDFAEIKQKKETFSDTHQLDIIKTQKDRHIKPIDLSIEQQESINNIILVISNIINSQKIINGKTRNSPNKTVMYESILNIVNKYPIEMINFIVKKNRCDLPMQSIIFQEFSKNMIGLLPIEFECNNKTIQINIPTDPKLKLFTGVCQFSGKINNNLVLKKPTTLLRYRSEDFSNEEVSSKYSFIGSVKRVFDDNGEDLFNCIDVYSFVNIRFLPKENIFVGKNVNVEYFAIPAHYSMQSMAHLRRIIKRIYISCSKKI